MEVFMSKPTHEDCPACHTPQSEIDQTFEELGIDLNDLLPCVCSELWAFERD